MNQTVHEIQLEGYAARPADGGLHLSLGTAESYGAERLHLTRGSGWEDLSVTAAFHTPQAAARPVRMLMDEDGMVEVPAEATAAAGSGVIVLTGLAEGVQRVSCNLPYAVRGHAPVEGRATAGPTPDVTAQILIQTAADRTAAAESARQAAGAVSHPPCIGENQTWLVWDAGTEEYQDTGVAAGGGPQVQADFDQNDSGETDYVKNRTHWKETVTTAVTIFGESTVTTAVNSKGYYVKTGLSHSNGAAIDEGNTFRVTFNGTVYSCLPKKATETALTANSLGNLSLMDSSKEDTGEPFLFRTGSSTLAVLATREAGDFTLQVDRLESEEVYHKLDANYLPLDPIDLTVVTEEGQTVTYRLWGSGVSDGN